ncbi:MAG: RNA polymerase subunit sigma-70 [Hyphomicrobium sp.]|nr:RNA polymerase subunit sigma-70 [Hyphomicrobium sp.]PPD09507.1 MAG: RNA polymerase subunit sigma-70 [Hyphomicrobium sp.]
MSEPAEAQNRTDEDLAQAAAAGDRRAFATLLDRHYDRIYRLAWRWCGARDRAEDIAQEVCVKLAQSIATFRGDAAFKSWLYRLAYTTAVDHIRANQRLVTLQPSDMLSVVDGAGGVTQDDTIEGQELWRAVRALPPQQRDAVLLVYAEDLSHAEAASILGCTKNTVSWHLHEARKRLKTFLEQVA